MKLVHIKNPNFEVMKKIVEIEQEAFEGARNPNGVQTMVILTALL